MKKEFISRVTKQRFRSKDDLRKVFENEQLAERRQARLHPHKELKGVFQGRYYRVKVPTSWSPSSMPKLLNPSSPPVKGFKHAETSTSKHHATTTATSGGGKISSSSSSGSSAAKSTISELRKASRAEREDYFRDAWDRARKWWKLNWPVLVLNFGSICSLVGFTRSDVLELRCLSVTGSLSSVVYFLSQAQRSMMPILWSLTFASVNGFKIYQILVERKAKVNLPAEQLDVYRRQFEPHAITPKQFQYIMQKAETIKLKKGDVLIREGEVLRNVYLVTKGHTRAHHMGRRLTAVSYTHDPMTTTAASTTPHSAGSGDHRPAHAGPPSGGSGAWIGEMAFFERNWYQDEESPVSAVESVDKNGKKPTKGKANIKDNEDASNQVPVQSVSTTERAMYTIVALEDDTTVLSWSHADMQALMDRSADMKAALTRAMTAAIVSKVVGFTMSRKATGGGGGPAAWVGRLWAGSTQGPVEPVLQGPPTVAVRKPVFSVPEGKHE